MLQASIVPDPNLPVKTDDVWQTRRFKLMLGLIALPALIGLGLAINKVRKESL
jgi:hypothetical protein